MIDATTSPTPVWQRYLVAGLVTALVVVLAVFIWTKELHHSAGTKSPQPPSAAGAQAQTPPAVQPAPVTTIPGGIPNSDRDPFTH